MPVLYSMYDSVHTRLGKCPMHDRNLNEYQP